jgi:uncharacterized protein (TIGR02246 family)
MTTYRSSMSMRLLSLALGISLVSSSAVPAEDAAAEQKAAIAKKAEALTEAYDKGDANAVAAFWTPDGDYTDLDGSVDRGRKAIAERFTEFFAAKKGATLRLEVGSMRFPIPETAITESVMTVVWPGGELPSRARLTNVLVKKDGEWLIASLRESAYEPPSNYEHLRPIEWLIGEWVEDTKGENVGRVRFEWTQDQNFILAMRAVGIKDVVLDNGSQRIGWDPAAKLIRSWNFESDGSFGQGSWQKDGNNWVIKMSSVLRSGSLMVGTTILTRVDADTIALQGKDQQLDGKALPDTPAIRMKRVQ